MVTAIKKSKQTVVDPVGVYLKEVSKIPRLSHEEEVAYGRQVRHLATLNELRGDLSTTLGRQPTTLEWAIKAGLSEPELQRAIVEGERAKRRMVEANLQLVVSVAKKHPVGNVELVDLIQEGAIGLQRGVEKFDPARGHRLSTCAHWWIRQEIILATRWQGRAIRLPCYVFDRLGRINEAQRKLLKSLGRRATVEELVVETKLSAKCVRACLEAAQTNVTSIDRRLGKDDGIELINLIPDNGIPPGELIAQSSLRKELGGLVVKLPERQQRVVVMHFGLDGSQPVSLHEVGRRLGLSKGVPAADLRRALERLRVYKHSLSAYLDQQWGNG